MPYTGTGSGVYNSDLAFKGNYVFQGTYEGFRVIDVTNKSNPIQLLNYIGLQRRPGRRDRLREHPDPLVGRSGRTPSATCAGQLVGAGFEGIHIFDITDPTEPGDGQAAPHGLHRQ